MKNTPTIQVKKATEIRNVELRWKLKTKDLKYHQNSFKILNTKAYIFFIILEKCINFLFSKTWLSDSGLLITIVVFIFEMFVSKTFKLESIKSLQTDPIAFT